MHQKLRLVFWHSDLDLSSVRLDPRALLTKMSSCPFFFLASISVILNAKLEWKANNSTEEKVSLGAETIYD